MKRILLTGMLVLSSFLIGAGCEYGEGGERHERYDRYDRGGAGYSDRYYPDRDAGPGPQYPQSQYPEPVR